MKFAALTFIILLLLTTLGVTISTAEAGKARIQALANNPACAIFNKNPQANETVTWTGPCKDGRAHGQGTETWRFMRLGEHKTETYVGEMQNGRRHGRGKVQWAGGKSYNGDWENGVRGGKGLYTWPAGNKYKDQFKNSKRHGQGIMVFNGGSKFKGAWLNSEKSGKGIFLYRNGDHIHGEFKNYKHFAVKCYVKAEKKWHDRGC